jgi:aryl-alcohol dehydrogenase-like predicted oxidoreductase
MAIRELPREEIVIGSKIAPSNVYPEKLRLNCEQSLRRLGQDYLDIYMVHWPIHLPAIRFHTNDPEVLSRPPRATDAFETLQALQQEGKIFHIGVSNFGIGPLDEALSIVPRIAVNQLAYSLVSRAIEWEILPYCQQKGVGVQAYMPLWQGLLTDGFSSWKQLPPIRLRTRHFSSHQNPLARHGEPGAEKEIDDVMRQIREVARRLDIPLAQLALRWSYARSGITSTVVGARSVDQLESNLRSTQLAMKDSVIAQLNEITRPLKEKLGPSFDYFEGTENDRTQYGSG